MNENSLEYTNTIRYTFAIQKYNLTISRKYTRHSLIWFFKHTRLERKHKSIPMCFSDQHF